MRSCLPPSGGGFLFVLLCFLCALGCRREGGDQCDSLHRLSPAVWRRRGYGKWNLGRMWDALSDVRSPASPQRCDDLGRTPCHQWLRSPEGLQRQLVLQRRPQGLGLSQAAAPAAPPGFPTNGPPAKGREPNGRSSWATDDVFLWEQNVVCVSNSLSPQFSERNPVEWA